MKKITIFVFFMSASIHVLGEIYQWKDEQGKVHYGEKNSLKKEQITEAEKVEIRDKYHISAIAVKEPITYTKNEAHRTISFSGLQLKLPRSDVENVRIGRVTCIKPVDLYWKDGSMDEKDPKSIEASIAVFKKNGYSVINSVGNPIDSPANLKLVAEVLDAKFNICPSTVKANVSQNATYLKIRWILTNPLDGKVLYSEISSGSHDALNEPQKFDGTKISSEIAFANATNNLLADPNFLNCLLPIDVNQVTKKFDTAVPASFKYGNGLGTFEEKVNTLKANSAIVKTMNGHGSGVLISNEGYVLTNAHVVGEENAFKVVVSGQEYDGKLVRKEHFRDVALIKLTNKTPSLLGVTIAQKEPNIGEEIFVIGTPLALDHSHTITKGIVSAARVIQGLSYLQTDAAINHGNSGGPVFDKKGELVALTVAGIFTRDGASANINYLIPIKNALSFLNITNAIDVNPILKKLTPALYENESPDEETPPLKKFLLYLLSWLNSPVL